MNTAYMRAGATMLVLMGVLSVGVSLGLGVAAVPVKREFACLVADSGCAEVVGKLSAMSLYTAAGGLASAGAGAFALARTNGGS